MTEPKGRGAAWTEERSDEGRRRLEAPWRRAGKQSGVLALGLLVCGCVFAAIAGPAESLHTRTQALRQTFAKLGSPAKAVEASAPLNNFATALATNGGQFYSSSSIPPLTMANLEDARSQLRSAMAGIPVPLAADDWAGLATPAVTVHAGYARSAYAETNPKLEVLYRDTLTGNVAVISGGLEPSGTLPDGTLAVSVTTQTAARFGLHPGSRLSIAGASLVVTGIVRVRGAASTFWAADALAAAPDLQTLGKDSPSFWIGAVFADPDQLATMQHLFRISGTLQWEFPLALGNVNADQAQALYNHLNNVSAALPALSGDLQSAASEITITTALAQPLSVFLATQTSVLTVLLLLFVSLIVVGAAVIVLAARMIADRRDAELVMLRARGASSRQLAGLLARGSAIAAIPAAAAGTGLAVAVVPGAASNPGGSAVLGWELAAATLALALAGPPLIGTWRHRRPAPAVNPARIMSAETTTARFGGSGLRRLVLEITAGGAAIAGLVVLHGQGLPPAGGTNWYLTVAPVLAAVPAVLLVLRLYPLVIRLLLRLARHRAGATSYIALAASARTSLATTGAAFALVLALTLAAFAGMVADAINAGQVAASWQAAGADAVVNTGITAVPVTPAAEDAIGSVPGVQHETAVWNTSWATQAGQQVTVTAVNPGKYAALTAATPFPRIPPGVLTTAAQPVTPDTVIDVLASPAAAAALGNGAVQLISAAAMGPIRIHVAGTLPDTPAEPGGGMFILMPLRTLPGTVGPPVPNVVLVTGASVDRARLDALVAKTLSGAATVYRSDTLANLSSSPLQHGALLLMLLTVFGAAGFGLLNLILGLAIGAPDRDLTFARLEVMGHAHGSRLAMTETLPAVLAAAIAGLGCAVVLPGLVGGALDLSVFTNSSASVALKPGFTSVGLPAAAMFVLAAAVLAVQTRMTRRRGVTGLLRAN
jgi:putative ABC transport system permease protein